MKIARGLTLPIGMVGESSAILAKKGAGKSNTAKVIVEEVLDHGGVQVVVLDPIGHWWSLRAGADGKPGGGYEVAVFGGQHGDLPLEPTAGKLLAETAVESRQSIILDVSSLDSDGAMQRFAYEFAEKLYSLKQAHPTPLLLVLEEADEFAPQDTRGANVPRMVGAYNRIVKRGRGRGIGTLVVTQRSAALNKNVLDQSDTLIVMRTIGPRDRKAIEDWVKYQQAEGLDEVIPSLASLETGEAWVWCPERALLQRVKVRKARTFDSSQTPKPGEAEIVAEVKPIDVEALGEAIKATVERVKENDPEHLRKQIRKLKTELSSRAAETVETERIVEIEKIVEVPVLTDEEREKLAHLAKAVDGLTEQAKFVQDGAAELSQLIEGRVGKVPPRTVPVRNVTVPVRKPSQDRKPPSPQAAPEPADSTVSRWDGGDEDVHLKSGAVRILETFARHYPMRMTKAQIGTLAKFKISGGTFQAYWSILKRHGFIEEENGLCWATEKGLERVHYVPQDPMTAGEILDQWRRALKDGAWRMLDFVVRMHPHGIDKEELSMHVEMTMSGGTFQAYLSTLRRNNLIRIDGGTVRVGEALEHALELETV